MGSHLRRPSGVKAAVLRRAGGELLWASRAFGMDISEADHGGDTKSLDKTASSLA